MTGAPTQLGDLARRLPRATRRMAAVHRTLLVRSRGRAFGSWFGAPVLVLETVGRRSGKRRATPLVYLPCDEGFAVVPANAGADRAPAWWLNLQAAGEGHVVLGDQRYRVRPAIAAAGEHEQVWRRMSAVAPVDHYQRRSRRELPVVILRPSAAAAPLRERVRARVPRLAPAATY